MGTAIRLILKELSFLQPIVILLKYLLRLNNLNETFTGGMGSFLAFNMVYSYFQYLYKSELIDYNFNLGTFFMGLLKFYSTDFNYEELGISLRKGGCFFRKYDNYYLPANSLLCVENFLDETQDIGKNNYNFDKVRDFFKSMYMKLSINYDERSLISLLIK